MAWLFIPRSSIGSVVIALGGPLQYSRVSEISPDEVVAALCRRLPPRNPELPRAA